MRASAIAAFCLGLSMACGRPFFTPPSTLNDFELDDPRRAVVGRWQIEFVRGDSVARGVLVLTDSLGSGIKHTLRGRLAVDLTPVLGYPMDCLDYSNGSHWVERADTVLDLAFAATGTHCWLTASTRWYGDSAVGQWTRRSQIVGLDVSGPFRMWRVKSVTE